MKNNQLFSSLCFNPAQAFVFFVALNPKERNMSNIPDANYFKSLLLSIYPCKEPFELLVVDKKPKTRMGVYIIDKRRIRIYTRWRVATPLEEIAIHEYAHHIHYTEQNKVENQERPHGPQFWEIYGALMCRAVQKGLYKEERVLDISKLNKP